MKGIIFDIKRFAVHDGPGIRTTVFFKGCPMACTWCHNPESKSQEISVHPRKIAIGDRIFMSDEAIGREITVEELMFELNKDKIFMDESGGGVTFSGGEPLQQADFLISALRACRLVGLHTALDTTGFSSLAVLKEVCNFTDLFLYDLKLMDDVMHLHFTGVSNQPVLSNLRFLLENAARVRIRIPVVPGITFTDANINAIIAFLLSIENRPESVDLLPYHSTAAHKYERLKLENPFNNTPSLMKTDLEPVKKIFETAGFYVNIGG